jgi:hypothetical protein
LSQPDGDRLEVVGVIRDVRNDGVNRPARPEIYVLADAVDQMHVAVRSDLPADRVVAAIRSAIRQADPTLPLNNAAR